MSTAGRTLPLRHAHVIVDARGGLARLVLQQRFENPHEVPLEITYSLPLPAEAAVSAFSFRIGDRRVVGQVDKKARARARYEEAIATGHTAALVEQERDTLFTQTLGNVPPGTAIEAEIVVDMKLRFLDDARAAGGGAWELRVPTTVAPRYLGEVGRVIDAERVAQDVSATAMPVHMTIEARLDATSASGTNAESPSHPIVAAFESGIEDGRGPHAVVRFQNAEGVSLDRDVVVRWPAARAEVAATAHVERAAGAEHAYALLTITPPRGAIASVPRDLILLLDTSGSMGGLPIEQAKRVSLALIESLAPTDTLEMISFSSSPKPWKRGALPMTPANRAAAIAWLSGLSASGGTEMRDAIVKALAPLRAGAQRQVVLVTDGLIGFEIEIVREILDRLPFGSRVHTVGVGSGINRTLTAGAARAGRGVEVIADAHEDRSASPLASSRGPTRLSSPTSRFAAPRSASSGRRARPTSSRARRSSSRRAWRPRAARSRSRATARAARSAAWSSSRPRARCRVRARSRSSSPATAPQTSRCSPPVARTSTPPSRRSASRTESPRA
ncbi:MAG: VIT and VWA domain-containing protein [Polyangiaceae bacterium]